MKFVANDGNILTFLSAVPAGEIEINGLEIPSSLDIAKVKAYGADIFV